MYATHTQSTVHFLVVKRAIFAMLLAIAAPLHAEQTTYTYDNLNRVIRADYGGGTAIEYSYDAAGNRLTRTVSANQPPVANAGADKTVNAGAKVALNGSGSNDPDHGPSPITYSWSQTSGPSVALANATVATPDFTPLAAGTYIFKLIVNDGLAESAPDTVTITVNDKAYLIIQAPNGGEVWNVGTKQTISWISHNIDRTKSLLLYLSTDNGQIWKKIAGVANVGSTIWNIPKRTVVSKQALLKICLNQKTPLCDTTDSVFIIKKLL